MLVCILAYLSQKTNQYKTFLEHLMSIFFFLHGSIKVLNAILFSNAMHNAAGFPF